MILITAATSAQAHKLKNELNLQDVVFGDYVEVPAFMQIVKLPNPASMSYAHEMLTLCLDMDIDKVYALKREEQTLLEQAEQLFIEYGIVLVHGS